MELCPHFRVRARTPTRWSRADSIGVQETDAGLPVAAKPKNPVRQLYPLWSLDPTALRAENREAAPYLDFEPMCKRQNERPM
jgi:hypothetical protein